MVTPGDRPGRPEAGASLARRRRSRWPLRTPLPARHRAGRRDGVAGLRRVAGDARAPLDVGGEAPLAGPCPGQVTRWRATRVGATAAPIDRAWITTAGRGRLHG